MLRAESFFIQIFNLLEYFKRANALCIRLYIENTRAGKPSKRRLQAFEIIKKIYIRMQRRQTEKRGDIYILYSGAGVVIGISDCTVRDLIISGFRDYHLGGDITGVITRRRMRLCARRIKSAWQTESASARADYEFLYDAERTKSPAATRSNFRDFFFRPYIPFPLAQQRRLHSPVM